jgi:hypothetical protein
MKCCICGTVKNCGAYLDKIFLNMKVIGSLFEKYVIILYYDHSNDNTLDKLKKRKSLNLEEFHYYVNNEPITPSRTRNIAKGRNKCLEFLKDKYDDYEYFIMMDCDDVCSGLFKPMVLAQYLLRNDWDGLSFNHPNGYYDAWAFSKDPLFLGCNHFLNGSKIYIDYITSIIRKTRGEDLIPCFSAFNGFAIYRTKKFLNCFYDGSYNLDYIPKALIDKTVGCLGEPVYKNLKEDCEHRRFHFQAIKENDARIRISPHCLFIKQEKIQKNLKFL